MNKQAVFVLVIGLLTAAPAMSEEARPLLTARSVGMTTLHPLAGSTVMDLDSPVSHGMRFTLPRTSWSRVRVGLDATDLKPYRDGALQVMLGGGVDTETCRIGLEVALRKDEEATLLAIQPLRQYGVVSDTWSWITIPVEDLESGRCRWSDEGPQADDRKIDWENVKALTLVCPPSAESQTGISLMAAQLARKLEHRDDEEGGKELILFDDATARSGGTYAIPEEHVSLRPSSDAKKGHWSVRVELTPAEWPAAGVFRAPSDLTPFLDEGRLEVWIKVEKHADALHVSLTDDRRGVRRVRAANYATRGLGPRWRELEIPLADFAGAESGDGQKPFDWTRVSGVMFDDGGDGQAAFLFDHVAVSLNP